MNKQRVTIAFLFPFVILSCNQMENKVASKLVDTPETNVTVAWDTSKEYLQGCSAYIKDGVLSFSITKHLDSLPDIVIEGVQMEDSVVLKVVQGYALLDCLYVSKRFQSIEKQVALNRNSYNSGDVLVGKLNLLLLGHESYMREPGELGLRKDWDTVRISGVFSSTVK